MLIPKESLSADVLTAIISEFILREGTDYGAVELSFDEKILQVKKQLDDGSAVVVFSELHETVNIMPADSFTE